MITAVSIAPIYVRDIDESKKFYTEVFGFEAKDDITMGDYRWCTVVHPNQPELQLHLTTPGYPHTQDTIDAINKAIDAGVWHGLGMNVDDCRTTVAELVEKGVTVLQEPSDRPYGTEAVVRDNTGNWVVLVEPRAWTEADFADPGA